MHCKGRIVILVIWVLVATAATNLAAETAAETKLLQLARERFTSGLSAAEEKMFRAAGNGGKAICTTDFDQDVDPANSSIWSTNRIIRADRLAWLCTDPVASGLVTYRGVAVMGSRFEGNLDLDWATISFPLALTECAFTKSISLRHSRLRAVCLDGTHIQDLRADGLAVEGELFLRKGFNAAGDVRLLGATIGGNLECDGSRIGGVLFADGARIEGAVFLREGFKAEGGVRFLYATIGRALDCHAGMRLSGVGRAS